MDPSDNKELMTYYTANQVQRKEAMTLSLDDVKVKIDLNHFVGQIINSKNCEIKMKCSGKSSKGHSGQCFTAPYVRCAEKENSLWNASWLMLSNLRVRNTNKMGQFREVYLSKQCRCEEI